MEKRSYDDLQYEAGILIRDYLRRELSKDFYNAKVQAVVIVTNTITGKVDIETCNAPLLADAKKMIREAYDQLYRAQVVNALKSVVAEMFKGFNARKGKK